jgi:hypothetical protein
MLTDRVRYALIQEKLRAVRARLGEPGAPGRVAAIAMKLISEKGLGH